MLIADADAGKLAAPTHTGKDEILDLLRERGIDYATWAGWYKLDEAERALGAADPTFPRERKKIVEWEDMLGHSRAGE